MAKKKKSDEKISSTDLLSVLKQFKDGVHPLDKPLDRTLFYVVPWNPILKSNPAEFSTYQVYSFATQEEAQALVNAMLRACEKEYLTDEFNLKPRYVILLGSRFVNDFSGYYEAWKRAKQSS